MLGDPVVVQGLTESTLVMKDAEVRNNIILVKLFLLSCHVDAEDLLHLGRQRFFHVFLDTSQQEGFEDFVKTLITVVSSFPVIVLKILPRIKPTEHNSGGASVTLRPERSLAIVQFFFDLHLLVRHEEMQQRPELFEGILQRGAGNEQPVVRPELHQRFVEQRVVVLQPVSLVHPQERPVDVPKHPLEDKIGTSPTSDLRSNKNGVNHHSPCP